MGTSFLPVDRWMLDRLDAEGDKRSAQVAAGRVARPVPDHPRRTSPTCRRTPPRRPWRSLEVYTEVPATITEPEAPVTITAEALATIDEPEMATITASRRCSCRTRRGRAGTGAGARTGTHSHRAPRRLRDVRRAAPQPALVPEELDPDVRSAHRRAVRPSARRALGRRSRLLRTGRRCARRRDAGQRTTGRRDGGRAAVRDAAPAPQSEPGPAPQVTEPPSGATAPPNTSALKRPGRSRSGWVAAIQTGRAAATPARHYASD